MNIIITDILVNNKLINKILILTKITYVCNNGVTLFDDNETFCKRKKVRRGYRKTWIINQFFKILLKPENKIHYESIRLSKIDMCIRLHTNRI